jgi:4-nitrophenyl phosphatase
MTGPLDGVQTLLVDMDGVLFRGGSPLPGATEFLPWLARQGIGFMLLTNNSTLTPQSNAEKLWTMGIEIDSALILTSSVVTAEYLLEQGARGAQAFVIGEEGLVAALDGAGIDRTDDPAQADWVVAGLDRRVTYEELRAACLAIEHGARFVATNADSSLPVEDGLIPGAGALQAAIIATTGVRPVVIGKPEKRMLDSALRHLDASRKGAAVLGDRFDTDMESAFRAGVSSILVLTGVATRDDVAKAPRKPDVVADGLLGLMTESEQRS